MADIVLPRRIEGSGGRVGRSALPNAGDVPQVRSSGDPGVRVPAGAFGSGEAMVAAGQGLADFGASLAKVSRAALAAQRDAAVSSATVKATAELKSFVLDLQNDTDYETYGERFRQRAEEAFNTHGQGLDERAKQKFRSNFERLSLEQAILVRSLANKRVVDAATADLDTSLDGFARIGADAATAHEKNVAVEQAVSAIRSAADNGVITREDAGKRERAFLSRLDEVRARQMIAADPNAALAELGSADAFPNMDEKQRIALFETATRRAEAIEREITVRADREERRAERELRRQGDEAAKDLDALLAEGRLTRDAVEAKRNVLSPTEYRGFLKALDPDERTVDRRDTIAELEPILGTPEAEALIDRAYRNSELKTETYRSLRNKNRELLQDDLPASPYKSGREFLSVGLDPGQISSEPTIRQPLAIARVRALRDYDNWIRANPGASPEDTQTKAEELLERYQNVAFGELRLSLPRPYGFAGAKNAVTAETLNEAALRIMQDQETGRLSTAEAARELSNLDVWERAIVQRPQKQASAR